MLINTNFGGFYFILTSGVFFFSLFSVFHRRIGFLKECRLSYSKKSTTSSILKRESAKFLHGSINPKGFIFILELYLLAKLWSSEKLVSHIIFLRRFGINSLLNDSFSYLLVCDSLSQLLSSPSTKCHQQVILHVIIFGVCLKMVCFFFPRVFE